MNNFVKVGSHQVVEITWRGERVITTAQLAEVYEANEQQIQQNFKNRQEKFQEKKHFILLKGDELKEFKNCFDDIEVVGKRASQLYLWTRRGASRHCKILDTEKAWEQFDCLEENYFNPHTLNVTYQYPLPAATFESVANLGRLIERIMKSEGAWPHEIAITLKPILEQAGINISDRFIKIPTYEQMSFGLLEGNDKKN